jgi:hypothetical protein
MFDVLLGLISEQRRSKPQNLRRPGIVTGSEKRAVYIKGGLKEEFSH